MKAEDANIAELVLLNTVPSPRGDLVGFDPPYKAPNPSKLKHETL